MINFIRDFFLKPEFSVLETVLLYLVLAFSATLPWWQGLCYIVVVMVSFSWVQSRWYVVMTHNKLSSLVDDVAIACFTSIQKILEEKGDELSKQEGDAESP